MKKDTTTIKRILRQTNVRDLHGYFKQDNNYILCNGISVIKFDSNNIDFLDDIEPSQSIHYSYDKFNNMFNDIKKAIQDNNNTIKIDIQDLKMWKKHADKNKPFVFKIGDNYAGVNAAYLLDLALLTRQDKNNAVTIQANNNKTPLYIAGNDVSAVLCLIGLKQDYNENDYNSFIDSLADCYTKEKTIQEEKHAKKAAKSTKTIEKETLYNGFTFWIARKQIFIISDKKKINDNVTKEFLNAITDVTGINCDNISDSDYKYIKSGINAATLLKTVSYYGSEEIYRIETKYNSENFYKNEYDRLIIYNGNMEKIDICADDMSNATDEETPKIATIQDNAADIVADLETSETKTSDIVKADNCTATETAATTETANNKDITNELIYDTYPIIHNNDVIEKGGYYINKGNYDYIITKNDFSGVYILYNLNYMHICGTNKDYFETVQDAINYLNTMNEETYFNSLKHLSAEEIYSIYKKYTPCQYHVIRQYIDKWNIKADTTQDIAPTTQDTTPTQDKPQKKSISLFIVADKPAPVKLPTLKQLDRIPMYVERFKTDFKQRNNARVYKYRVDNKKPLKKAYNDFVGTVTCYNDKCAIGGKVAAGNTS